MPDRQSPVARSSIRPTARIVAWGLAAAIVVLSVVPPNLRPETGLPNEVEHFGIFLATGFAFGVGYRRRHGRLALVLVIFCGAIEIMQLFAPGRHARLGDFIVDALAICVGVATAALVSSMNGWRG